MKQHPDRLKFKKYQKIGRSYLLKEQKIIVPLRPYALKTLQAGSLTFAQLEACRKVVKRGVGTHFKFNMFCAYPITKKSVASRMGKGKGNHSNWVACAKVGSIICEVTGISSFIAIKVLTGISAKLPLKTKIIRLKY